MRPQDPWLTESVGTDRLVLQQPNNVDSMLVLAFLLDNKVFHAPWEPVRHAEFYTEDAVQLMLNGQARENATGSALHLYLQRPQASNILGIVSLSNIIYGAFLSCFLGYRMARCETCHGYMGEAVGNVIDIAFQRYGLHRIEANIMPGNHASIRLVEKLGFINEGYSSRYLKIAGCWEGHSHYVLLNDDLEHPDR
jgi:ribosomal-protein-alanine N-acetyltransferase